MWLIINNEMWNLENAERITTQGNKLTVVYPNYSEQFELSDGISASSTFFDIELALDKGKNTLRVNRVKHMKKAI